MHTRYRISLVALALLTLSTATPPPAAAQPATDALTLADFVGRWWHHGMSVTINPDGTADMDWRRGGAGVDIGRAALRVDRVEGRTLYGTVLTTNYADGLLTRGPFQLTEYDYGIGELVGAHALGLAAIGAPEEQGGAETVCGPRYADAPRWFTRISPCGA